jgi:hypothetical protein
MIFFASLALGLIPLTLESTPRVGAYFPVSLCPCVPVSLSARRIVHIHIVLSESFFVSVEQWSKGGPGVAFLNW